MITELEIAQKLKHIIQAGADPADLSISLYQSALGWAQEEGAIDIHEYAGACTRRIWEIVATNDDL